MIDINQYTQAFHFKFPVAINPTKILPMINNYEIINSFLQDKKYITTI